MKVAVVTPTIGQQQFSKCLDSVQQQDYENLIHYVFLDGQEHYDKIHPMLYQASGKRTIKTISLEDNVGKGWYGHRVYAACSYLVNADIIMYLDEDNWYEPNHVSSLVDVIVNQKTDWAFSLRKIYDKSENYLCEDNCESLGNYSAVFNENRYHIDTSCFAVKRDIALRIGHTWYAQWGGDRVFYANINKHFPNYKGSGKYTLCYRTDGNEGSVNKNYFEYGNRIMSNRYNNSYPWAVK